MGATCSDKNVVAIPCCARPDEEARHAAQSCRFAPEWAPATSKVIDSELVEEGPWTDTGQLGFDVGWEEAGFSDDEVNADARPVGGRLGGGVGGSVTNGDSARRGSQYLAGGAAPAAQPSHLLPLGGNDGGSGRHRNGADICGPIGCHNEIIAPGRDNGVGCCVVRYGAAPVQPVPAATSHNVWSKQDPSRFARVRPKPKLPPLPLPLKPSDTSRPPTSSTRVGCRPESFSGGGGSSAFSCRGANFLGGGCDAGNFSHFDARIGDPYTLHGIADHGEGRSFDLGVRADGAGNHFHDHVTHMSQASARNIVNGALASDCFIAPEPSGGSVIRDDDAAAGRHSSRC
eukprot:TRINITY_DN46311_c0_g1_i1.p1 TRINITY_DN46311_c0_g1~~TRINITY_DN46311_c0_g1_i1.p1  ORF type:complete len:344 (-),score=44.16 TRINITY_DN46311_c0_g1_i1:72-1103(-)